MTRPQQNWPISADKILALTEQLPEQTRSAVMQLHYYCRERGLTIDDAADGIGYHTRNVEKLIRGEYEGNLDQITEAIVNWLDHQRAAEASEVLFVETSTARSIWQICQLAWDYRTIGAIWGDSQIGKTEALAAFKRKHAPGKVRFIRFPTESKRHVIMLTVAKAAGLPSREGALEPIRQRIFEVIGPDDLVIFDELHEPFLVYNDGCLKYALELVREIHDLCKCGVVLSGTNVGRDGIRNGKFAGVFEQLRRRTPFTLQLPPFATRADLNAIAAHFALPRLTPGTAADTVTAVVQHHGLKAYLIYLKAGKELARNRRQEFSWDHVVAAHDLIAKAARPRAED